MNLTLEHRLQILRDFTVLELDRVSEMARGGCKDMAREWVNYMENGRILDVLADLDPGVLTGAEKTRLYRQLQELRSFCHPLDVPNYANDFAAIRGELKRITEHLGLDRSPDIGRRIVPSLGSSRITL